MNSTDYEIELLLNSINAIPYKNFSRLYLGDLNKYCKRTNNKLHTSHESEPEFCHSLIKGLKSYFSYEFLALDLSTTIASFNKIFEQSIVLAYWVNDDFLKELANFYPDLYVELSVTLKTRKDSLRKFYEKCVKKQYFNEHHFEIIQLQDSILSTIVNPSYLRAARLNLHDALMHYYKLKKNSYLSRNI